VVGKLHLDVQDRQRQHQQEAGQHEADLRKQATYLAASYPAEINAQLVRLGAGQHLVDGQRLLEGLLVDPVLLVDALALDHRDLRRRAAPGERPELQEANEDRERRIVRQAWRLALLRNRLGPHRAGQSDLSED